MPLSLPIIAPPPSATRSGDDGRGRSRSRARPRRRGSCGSALGSSTPSIMRICAFSPWPAPTMVFLTRFGAYSATGSPAIAGTSSAIPRAWPSLSVAAASLLTKVASTAASSGASSATTRRSPSWIVTSRSASVALSSVASEPQARKTSRLPSIAMTPQPVRRSPGSIPRMRIARAMMGSLITPAPSNPSRSPCSEAPDKELPSTSSSEAPQARRDRTPRQRDVCRHFRGPAHLCGDGGVDPRRRGARLLRLRLGADLRAADERHLRPAHRRRHLPADRFRGRRSRCCRRCGGRRIGATCSRSRPPP